MKEVKKIKGNEEKGRRMKKRIARSKRRMKRIIKEENIDD